MHVRLCYRTSLLFLAAIQRTTYNDTACIIKYGVVRKFTPNFLYFENLLYVLLNKGTTFVFHSAYRDSSVKIAGYQQIMDCRESRACILAARYVDKVFTSLFRCLRNYKYFPGIACIDNEYRHS